MAKLITSNLEAVILDRTRPGITLWNRLEGRPRADDFLRALRAEVRDPLWMLTRQWQHGEFRGDDAGSPILGKVQIETTRLHKYQPAGGPVAAFDDSIPLEARVEALPVPLEEDGHEIALDVRLLAGRHWQKLVKSLAPAAVSEFVTNYPIHEPDPADIADARTCAHVEAWSSFAAVATRRMDGIKLYRHLKAGPPNRASDGITALAGLETQADALASRFVAWLERLLHQPSEPPAWLPSRLEYQFASAAPERSGETVYVAEEYFHGHLDWYNVDVDPTRTMLGDPAAAPEPPKRTTFTMLPTAVTFNGMPNTRYWAFEDGRTNFGDVKPDTTDLGKLLLLEFGLIYANDWFIVPFSVPAGSVVRIRGIAVTNVFGERTWIEGAGRGDDDDWQRWAMFSTSIQGKGHEPAELALFVPPTAHKVLNGPAYEELLIARDEGANMVWAIEKTIALPSGAPKPGREAATETRAAFEREADRLRGGPAGFPPAAEGAKVRYQLMNSVPENWIPMLAVHVPGDVRETQLQRGAMLRIIDGLAPAKVSPRTSLLRVGLDEVPKQPYFLHEEEVPRAGTQVTKNYQRTRWYDGRAWVWLGVRKQTGRGEGSSGLAFDSLEDVRRTPP